MTSRVLAVVLASLVSLASAPPLARTEPLVPAKDPADALMKKELDALKANDLAAFVADGTPQHRSLNKGAFALVAAHFGPLLMKGYKTTFLAKLRKPAGTTLELWKLEPAGAEEDFELKLVLVGGKVDAFSIQ